MIKFFRKIRQKLLTENKFSKYLIYAIGEIVLVVIGILIALQINNWNENKAKTEKEIFHLKNISSNLEMDLNNEIINGIEYTERQMSAYELLKSDFYEKDKLTNDSIRKLFFQNLNQWDLVLNTVAFENLKSSGMDLISNDSIKIQILTLYGTDYKYIERLHYEITKFHSEGVTTIMADNVNMWNELTDKDRKFLKNNFPLSSRLQYENYSNSNFLGNLNRVKPNVEKLIQNIANEIEHLENK